MINWRKSEEQESLNLRTKQLPDIIYWSFLWRQLICNKNALFPLTSTKTLSVIFESDLGIEKLQSFLNWLFEKRLTRLSVLKNILTNSPLFWEHSHIWNTKSRELKVLSKLQSATTITFKQHSYPKISMLGGKKSLLMYKIKNPLN